MTIVPVASDARGAPTPAWYAHGWNRAVFYALGGAVAGALPRPVRLRLAEVLGALGPAAFPAERTAVAANLARVVPDASPARRGRLVRRVFRRFAVCFADLLAGNGGNGSSLLATVQGEHHLTDALAHGRGLVVLTAHLGNWELAGRLLVDRARRPTHVVVAAEADPGVQRFLRGRPGPIRFVERGRPTAALALIAALRRGEVVALQGDRALGDRSGSRARFFGAPAWFPLGPFVLARAAGAPVVPAFCVLGDDWRYRITVDEPFHVGLAEERQALARWVDGLERVITAHPDQWFNFFDVWGDHASD
jgi:lauroyl/myristoyl acyltransferase